MKGAQKINEKENVCSYIMPVEKGGAAAYPFNIGARCISGIACFYLWSMGEGCTLANIIKDVVSAILCFSEAKTKKEVYQAIFSSVIDNSDDPAYVFESDKIWRIEHGGGLCKAISDIIAEDFMTESITKDIRGYLEYKHADMQAFKEEMEKLTKESGLCEKEREKILNSENGARMAALLLQRAGSREKEKGKKKGKGEGKMSLLFEDSGCMLTLCSGTALMVGKDEDGELVVRIN